MSEVKKCPSKKCGGEMLYVEAQGEAPAEYVCRNCGYKVPARYHCVVCGRALGFKGRNEVHNHYLDELAALFQRKKYKIITEDGIPEFQGKEWGKPDIFVLKSLALHKIVEIVVGDSYEKLVYCKCKKIRDYYNLPEIIVFEPTDYTDKVYLPGRRKYCKEHVLSYEPDSYKQLQKHYQPMWKKEGLNVIFWNEWNLQDQKEKVGVES